MEIVKRGVLPTEVVHQATCNHCGTVAKFKRGEAEHHFDQREGDYLSVQCPVCACEMYARL